MTSSRSITDYLSTEDLTACIRRTKTEDLSPDGIDLTSRYLAAGDRVTTAAFVPRQAGVVAGTALLPFVVDVYNPTIHVETHIPDGQSVDPGRAVARVTGPVASILALERVALNFMTHLSGIATLTRRYVDAVAHTTTQIYDTRKTIPGLRALEKYAVACGGGCNHRMGLYDAVLIKDNHLAAAATPADLPALLAPAIDRARSATPPPRFIEVEVDRLDQLAALLDAPVASQIDIVLLDNMTLDDTRRAVQMRNEHTARPQTHPRTHSRTRIELEASGGVTLDNVAAIAATGVDRIAVGAITHSAPALDIGLDLP